ncbi:crosslink repair DNA glycosylase YcaQ family protein [Sinomonas sp. JGH33]|uniref:Crosslink repair DNA glycosylase YcaQ family protein n=1 Tax=Sinomonas terricola TaxID=3110330 RepID=A0ABU5T0J3_9MICC|nr:crosslink repair DNA glycosylase YcaQ family protein [Sinomonas sp. JGH33]MEA5453110.1 crosslink repair DNA glycosylase YcaQ family protein [Sinomonas sp. JGH33]
MGGALSLSQARRIALSAQGLIGERPTAHATARAVGRTFDRLQLVQIDSVNVLVRSHYLPFFSRLGPYDRSLLDRLASRSPRRMVEYWAHEASFIKPEHFEALRLWQNRTWVGAGSLETAIREDLAARILDILATSRPLTSAQLTERLGHIEERRNDNWGWNWNAVKRVVSDLFAQGIVSSAGRTPSFERRYALTEAVLPPGCRGAGIAPGAPIGIGPGATLGVGLEADRDEAALVLSRAALAAHGIGTSRCIADYFRLPVRATERALAELVRTGEAEPVSVHGWGTRLYKDPAAAVPRSAKGRALLSPFDSLVFERRRLEELFDFHYRIEIYTPSHRRRFGYYVLPFLFGETMAARVDLKADRPGRALLVQAVHGEPDAPAETAVELAAELRLLADWLGLDDVRIAENGSLSAAVAHSLGERQSREP